MTFHMVLGKNIDCEQFKRLLKTCWGIEIAAHCDHLFKLHLYKFSY